jgi:hypothetical protein
MIFLSPFTESRSDQSGDAFQYLRPEELDLRLDTDSRPRPRGPVAIEICCTYGSEVGVERNACKNILDTVMIKASDGGYGSAELTAKPDRLNHLKSRIVS